MRVLEVFGEPIASGGQEAFIFNVLRHMDRTDLTVDFFTPYFCSNSDYKALIEACGGQLFRMGLPFRPGKSRRNIIRPLREHLRHEPYDAVHIHSGSTTILAYGAYTAHAAGVPQIIVHSHVAAQKSLKHSLIRAYAAPYFRKYPTAFCACSYEAGEAKFPEEILRSRLQIIKNGIDLERFAFNPDVRTEYRRQLGMADGTVLLGHVGRFSEQKNHRFDLEVLQALRKQRPVLDIKLLWIGEGELEPDLRQMVKAMQLEDTVIFQGVVNNVNDYLQAVDVFLFPSLYEGLGIVGVEAQAAGLPVLASDAIPEELQLTDSIRFLPIENPEVWASMIPDVCRERKPDNIIHLKKQGYSIQETSAAVRKLYFKPDQLEKDSTTR